MDISPNLIPIIYPRHQQIENLLRKGVILAAGTNQKKHVSNIEYAFNVDDNYIKSYKFIENQSKPAISLAMIAPFDDVNLHFIINYIANHNRIWRVKPKFWLNTPKLIKQDGIIYPMTQSLVLYIENMVKKNNGPIFLDYPANLQ